MPSKKNRRDFAPEKAVIEELDNIPLLKRSKVINEALRAYFNRPNDAEFTRETLTTGIEDLKAGIEDLKRLLTQLIKHSRK